MKKLDQSWRGDGVCPCESGLREAEQTLFLLLLPSDEAVVSPEPDKSNSNNSDQNSFFTNFFVNFCLNALSPLQIC